VPRAATRPPARQLVSVAAAAERADVSTRTVRRWIVDGRLPAYRAGSTLIKVDVADLDKMLRPIAAGTTAR
jgi:excisionase family DNA binding protein